MNGRARFARVALAVAGTLMIGVPIVVVAAGLVALANGTAAVVEGAATNLPKTVRMLYHSHPILDLWPVPPGIVVLSGSVALGRGTSNGWRLGVLGALALAAYAASQLPPQVSQLLAAPPDARTVTFINVALVSAIIAIAAAAAWDVWRARIPETSPPITR